MKRAVQGLYMAVLYLFLYAPILVLIVFSFNDGKSMAHWDGFTLRWYVSLFQNEQIMQSLYQTLALAAISALVATVLGTAAAIAIHGMRPWAQTLIMNLTYIPVLNADIVTGIGLMLLFIFMHLDLGFVSVLLAHITFNLPYVILSVMPKLKQLDHHIYEAALDLGATPWQAIRKVIIPEIMPGVFTGALLAVTLSIDDFVVSFFTAGAGVNTLSMTIFSMARRGIKPEINALSALLFVSVLALLLLVNRRGKKGDHNVLY